MTFQAKKWVFYFHTSFTVMYMMLSLLFKLLGAFFMLIWGFCGNILGVGYILYNK